MHDDACGRILGNVAVCNMLSSRRALVGSTSLLGVLASFTSLTLCIILPYFTLTLSSGVKVCAT